MNLHRVDTPKTILFLSTLVTMSFVFLILFFLVITAWPVLSREGTGFILGTTWDYSTNTYGIAPLIACTFWLTVTTLVMAVPAGILIAIYLAEFAPVWLDDLLRSFIELLVGIPSVVYGLFGFFILEPIFRNQVKPFISTTLGFIPVFKDPDPSTGFSILLAAFILTIMVLPTIVALTRESIKAVPHSMREASLALGATRSETIFRIVIPIAFAGIMTSIVLATMRAMGETMAIAMVMGGSGGFPTSILNGGYAMTTKILADIGYYASFPEPKSALFAIATVLFVMEIGFVALMRLFTNWQRNRYAQ